MTLRYAGIAIMAIGIVDDLAFWRAFAMVALGLAAVAVDRVAGSSVPDEPRAGAPSHPDTRDI